ncbi:MAG: biopolymer transporter ExbD [Bacteroidales bacterium]|jgi:biopolymer transport protein ExbD|nr:biopolymer transporter ExbD [Bacteroidales bacterium]
MAIRTSSKINASFSMSSMTDLVFLLLIFFMITSTLVSPNALKLLLPQSNNQTSAKAITSVSVTKDLQYAVDGKYVSYNDLERQLQQKLMNAAEPTVSIHMDRTLPVEELVKIMNIAARNKYKAIIATAPERK